MCIAQDPPALVVGARLCLDIALSDDGGQLWLAVKTQTRLSELERHYSDWATVPTAERVICEWENIIGAYLESLIGDVQSRQISLSCIQGVCCDDLEEGTTL